MASVRFSSNTEVQQKLCRQESSRNIPLLIRFQEVVSIFKCQEMVRKIIRGRWRGDFNGHVIQSLEFHLIPSIKYLLTRENTVKHQTWTSENQTRKTFEFLGKNTYNNVWHFWIYTRIYSIPKYSNANNCHIKMTSSSRRQLDTCCGSGIFLRTWEVPNID